MPREVLYREGLFRFAIQVPKVVPRCLCHWAARRIADSAWCLAPRMRALTAANFATAFGISGAALARLVRLNFRRFSESVSDYFASIARSPSWVKGLVSRYEGEEHLENARRSGKGALIVTAHFGSWELGGLLLSLRGIPLTVVTLREPSEELNRWRQKHRERNGIKTLTIGQDQFAIIEIARALERGEFVAMLVDRPTGGDGLAVPFFDRPTCFSSAPGLIWQHVGAPVLPAHVVRAPGGRYVSAIGEPLPFVSGPDRRRNLVVNTGKIAEYFCALIRQHPEQWYNYTPLWGARG